jgi:tetratricopeptide (TPR) repeat protein
VARRALLTPFLLVLAAGSAACLGTRIDTRAYDAPRGSYDSLDELGERRVTRARQLLDAGRVSEARELIARVLAEHPQVIPLGILGQEARMVGEDAQSAEQLLAEAEQRAARDPSPTALLLAARLDPDPESARRRIERALELDESCAWAHYALAHLEARSGFWREAQQRLARALELDPGNPSARRLEAGLLARDGKVDEATRAYEAWIEATEDDALVDPLARLMAQLDLAQLYLLDGHQARARSVLLSIPERSAEPARRLCILAAVEQAAGRPERALELAQSAEVQAPRDSLPLQQQAALYEDWLESPEAAARAWERVLELTRDESSLGSLILSMRARVALERSTTRGEAAP